MKVLANPYRGKGLAHPDLAPMPWPSVDAARVRALLARCPEARETPLLSVPGLARRAGVARIDVKDERGRMDLGSFKALGAAYVIARDAEAGRARGATYVAASAGNHGLSVAAGARVFGARAVIYLAETVPQAFADRLRAEGAEIVREGATYEDSMQAAGAAAEDRDWRLLSDSSWPGYAERPHILMEGYLALMDEVIATIDQPPTHIFLQAGVGGLAAAAAALARAAWGPAPKIIVVEPDAAPALIASVAAAAPVVTKGPVSAMGRLDCKAPSLIALKGLARDADTFMTITEGEAASGLAAAVAEDLPSTPSGAAGIAGCLAGGAALGLDARARVLCILSEGPE